MNWIQSLVCIKATSFINCIIKPLVSVVVSGLSYWLDTGLIQTTNCDTNQCLSTRNSDSKLLVFATGLFKSYWLKLLVRVIGLSHGFVSKLVVFATSLCRSYWFYPLVYMFWG